jgi:hypothetical protein
VTQPAPPSADQFLQGGTKSASFKEKPLGFGYTGTIVADPVVSQQTDPDTGELEFWPSGDPKWQLVVKIATALRDDETDDGVRAIYVKGKSLTDGVKKAVQDAGVKSLRQGGTLTVQYIADGPPPAKAHHSRAKLYKVTYAPPTPDQTQAQFFGDGSPVPAGPPGMAAVHQQNAAAAVAASIPAAPFGVDPAVWASMTDAQRTDFAARLQAARNASAAPADTPPF